MRKIDLLCTEQDLEALQPVLEQLQTKGVRAVQTQTFSKGRTVLAVLSENFYADVEKTGALLDLISGGAENVMPLQLDGARIPENIMNSLYSRNIIMPEGRDAALIAERIISALPQKKNRMPLILSIAGIALLAVIGFVIWRSLQGREPAAPEPSAEPAPLLYNLPEGITAEDLEKIVDVIIVGEQLEYYTSDKVNSFAEPDWDYFAYRDFRDGEAHWYSREDGHEYKLTRYNDLRFIEMMPNLRFLTMAQIETGELPQLGGLKKLTNLMIMDCVIPDLEWLSGSGIRKADIINSKGTISDFSPLTSCEKLDDVHIDLVNNTRADLSGFAPPALERLWINNGQDLQSGLSLSSLSSCSYLRDCQLEYHVPITDISFLSGASRLERLMLYELPGITDISALRSLEKLRDLNLDNCDSLRDYSPISACKNLETIMIDTDRGRNPLRNASFLSDLPKLRSINLGGVDLQNIDFLNSLAAHRTSLDNFGVWGTVRDWSGLAAIKNYRDLNIDPDPDSRPDFKRDMLPYLEDAKIDRLSLRRFTYVDLSALPKIGSYVELDRCGIKDLSTMSENWTAYSLNLNKCSSLGSLEGLQNQKRVTTLMIYQCPRLTDWSALEGMRLNDLKISWCFTLPDFSKLSVSTLRIEGIEDVTDLDFLSGMDTTRACNFELVGLDNLKNIQPLSRFHGSHLTVSPQLAEQAEDLVKAGNFSQYDIEYPEGGWEMDNIEITLRSLKELDSLPPAMLRHVTQLCLVGDAALDIGSGNVWTDWTNKGPVYMYQPWDSNDAGQILYGEGYADILERLSVLTGLRKLWLYKQPITSLDGIQNFPELEELQIADCNDLKDASAAFACQGLRNLRIDSSPITSIQGVQNLWYLDCLNINGTQVSDLSPLSACDFSAAVENGGLCLMINNLPVKDYSPLTGLPLDRLDIHNTDAELFIPFLEGKSIRYIELLSCFNAKKAADNNELFARFVQGHPELEHVDVKHNVNLTDLTPLLELGELKEVCVSNNMKKAIDSLKGKEYSFELRIEN